MDSLTETQEFFNRRKPWIMRMTHAILTGLGDRLTDWEEMHQNVLTLTWNGVMHLYVHGTWEPNRLKACVIFAIRQHRAGRTIYSGSTKPRIVTFTGIELDFFSDLSDPIPQVVQTRLDWAAYLETLSERWQQHAVDALETGMSNLDLASKWGVTPGRACQIRKTIRDGYLAFLKHSM